MMPWVKQGVRASLVAAVVISTVVLAGGERTWALDFVFQIALDGNAPIFVRNFELGEDNQGPTLTVSAGFNLSPGGLGALQVGQRFDAAVLRIFDTTLTPLASYRLSSVRVRSVRGSGDGEAVTQEVVLSGKAVTVSFP